MYSTLVMYPSVDIYFWFEFINVVLRIVILVQHNTICFNRNESAMTTNQFLLLLFRFFFHNSREYHRIVRHVNAVLFHVFHDISWIPFDIIFDIIRRLVEYLIDESIILTSSSTSLRFCFFLSSF